MPQQLKATSRADLFPTDTHTQSRVPFLESKKAASTGNNYPRLMSESLQTAAVK